MILFGVRSPLVVEYEEACNRLGLAIEAAVSLNGSPRLLDLSPVVELNELPPSVAGKKFIACAFVPSRRVELIARAERIGLVPAAPLIDPSAVLAQSVCIGEGSFINAGVIIGAVSMIGNDVLINRSASLGHHTVLGNHVSIGPGATLAGNIRVGAGTVIGAGATILPHIRIGEDALVAAGSVVRTHVSDGVLVAGNPARKCPKKSNLYVEHEE